jgi:hypothetical protein
MSDKTFANSFIGEAFKTLVLRSRIKLKIGNKEEEEIGKKKIGHQCHFIFFYHEELFCQIGH